MYNQGILNQHNNELWKINLRDENSGVKSQLSYNIEREKAKI